MDLEEIKRGLRAEIKKRENEQYLTFQCNVRQMCKDVLTKLEEQESEIADLIEKNKLLANKDIIMASETIKDLFKKINHHKYKRCLAFADMCSEALCYWDNVKYTFFKGEAYCFRKMNHYGKWGQIWLAIAEKFKEAK